MKAEFRTLKNADINKFDFEKLIHRPEADEAETDQYAPDDGEDA